MPAVAMVQCKNIRLRLHMYEFKYRITLEYLRLRAMCRCYYNCN